MMSKTMPRCYDARTEVCPRQEILLACLFQAVWLELEVLSLCDSIEERHVIWRPSEPVKVMGIIDFIKIDTR